MVNLCAFNALHIATSALSQEHPITVGFTLKMAFAARQVLLFKFDKLVLFMLIHAEVWAIKVEKAVR